MLGDAAEQRLVSFFFLKQELDAEAGWGWIDNNMYSLSGLQSSDGVKVLLSQVFSMY